ncbi:MAG: ribonuclease HI [Clostridia bacterium]|nr:ribonuclease HI [Clostridia bacterium]
MKHVDIYTDGACKNNPGPGGYGAILVYNGREKEISGGDKHTTNNRMELLAAINGLKMLREPCEVTLYSDSKYLIDSIEKGWVYSWQKNGWRKADKSPALNVELWTELLALIDYHKVSFVWVKGHAGHIYNERCDRLAVAGAEAAALM